MHNGVHVFRGVPYGASTAGANRFLPPRKPDGWTGVRDAFQNGHSSPQIAPAPSAIGFAAGTLVVWDVDVLHNGWIHAYRAAAPQDPTVYRRGEIADAEPALPEWTLPVDDPFLSESSES